MIRFAGRGPGRREDLKPLALVLPARPAARGLGRPAGGVPGSRAPARWPRTPSRGRGDALAAGRRQRRRRGAGLRRRDAAHPDPGEWRRRATSRAVWRTRSRTPLTPIQLCAERMRRQFSTAPAPARARSTRCTATIVGEVESLKALVDEFAQFARMPAPRAVPADLNAALAERWASTRGSFVRFRSSGDWRPNCRRSGRCRADATGRHQPGRQRRRSPGGKHGGRPAEQQPPAIIVETRHDRGNGVVRILVSDNRSGHLGGGPATSCSCRITRPSAAAAASGWRSSADHGRHGGSIEVADNVPSGTRSRSSCRRDGRSRATETSCRRSGGEEACALVWSSSDLLASGSIFAISAT